MAGLWPAGWAPGDRDPAHVGAAAPLILTVALPDALQRQADAVRGACAPQAAARAPAHLTLFRHLPSPEAQAMLATTRQCVAGPAPQFRVLPPQSRNGRWFARVDAPGLDALRAELADRWHGLLAPGDLAPPRLHISLSSGRSAPPALAEGPWRARGLLFWVHRAPDRGGMPPAGTGFYAKRGGAFWTPLVAVAFRG